MAKDKKKYEAPELTDYGTIEDVTKGVGLSGDDLIVGGAVEPSPDPGPGGSGPLV